MYGNGDVYAGFKAQTDRSRYSRTALLSEDIMIKTISFRGLVLGTVSLLTGMSLFLTAPSFARAEQFVLFDVTFTYTKADADNSRPSKSHYYVRDKLINPDRPRDWTAPVDYRNGTVHIRAEIIDKPAGGEPTTWTICYIPNKGQKNGYGCTGTGIFREKGVYEQDVSMKSFWENDSIIWSEGIKQMDLVIKDNSGGGGHAHKRKDHEKFFPTKVRITMVQVSAGSTYDPSLVPNLPPAPKASGAKLNYAHERAGTKAVSGAAIALPAAKLESGCCGCGE
jgi:hypothetical protein